MKECQENGGLYVQSNRDAFRCNTHHIFDGRRDQAPPIDFLLVDRLHCGRISGKLDDIAITARACLLSPGSPASTIGRGLPGYATIGHETPHCIIYDTTFNAEVLIDDDEKHFVSLVNQCIIGIDHNVART